MRKSIQTMAVVLAGLGSQWALAENADHVLQVQYQCERGITVPVTYVNTASGSSYAVLQVDGQQLLMENVVSASGARYTSLDAKRGQYTWDTKGNTGYLYWQLIVAADESGEPVLSECAANEEMFASQESSF